MHDCISRYPRDFKVRDMASGMVFDPWRLIRIAPMITSTGTLVCATLEFLFNTASLEPSIRPKIDKVLPKWYSTYFRYGIWLVVGLLGLTVSTIIFNLLVDRNREATELSTSFYWIGLAATFGHLLFVPRVSNSIRNMVEDGRGEPPTNELENWLKIHRLRILVADLPAWLACLAAVLTDTSL